MKMIEKIKKIEVNVDVQKVKDFWKSLPFVKNETLTEDEKLLQEIQDVHDELFQARAAFDLLSHRELIESCIYQIESLEVKYNYLIKQAREKGLSGSFVLQQDDERTDARIERSALRYASSKMRADCA